MNIDLEEFLFYFAYFTPIILSGILATVFNNNWFLINTIPNIFIVIWAILDKLQLTPHYWKLKKEKVKT